MNTQELWQAVLAQVQLDISSANFATWFKNTSLEDVEKGKAVVTVPNSFVKEWLANKYHKKIFKTLYNLDGSIKEINYVVSENKNSKKQSTPKQSFEPEEQEEAQLGFQAFQVNRETNLNPKYTFDSFVVGPFNKLPHAAALAVTEKPGSVYNPLFLYGGVGLGKTHLLQATGNKINQSFPKKKVKYISSEKFTSEVIEAIKNQKADLFKAKCKAFDVLIIDDVQFLAGKEKTQEEFFHIFNVLYEKNKQIIISSDRPPKSIHSLAERLRSRFEGGMIADISAPDYETRVAILKTKAQEKNQSFSKEIYEYVASMVQRNIRELEGALNRLIIYEKINNKKPDLEIAKNLLKNLIFSPTRVATPKKIIQQVAEFYDLKEKDLLTSSRKKEIVRPRQIAMYLLREELKSSFPFIGRKFSGKDHTTAIHSYKKILAALETNKKLEEEISLIKERVFNSS
jgi:chromosomal replication initiator protein